MTDHTPAPQPLSVAGVTREETVSFLEIATRNWRDDLILSEDEIGDVAIALLWFVRKRAGLRERDLAKGAIDD